MDFQQFDSRPRGQESGQRHPRTIHESGRKAGKAQTRKPAGSKGTFQVRKCESPGPSYRHADCVSRNAGAQTQSKATQSTRMCSADEQKWRLSREPASTNRQASKFRAAGCDMSPDCLERASQGRYLSKINMCSVGPGCSEMQISGMAHLYVKICIRTVL